MLSSRFFAGTMFILLSLGLCAVPTQAAGITSALLSQSDAPAGFGGPHIATFNHFTRRMRVEISVSGSKVRIDAVCYSPAALAGSGWTAGAVEGFDVQQGKPFRALTVCAWVLASPRRAHAAFLTLTAPIRASIGRGHVRRITAHLGGESLAAASPGGASSRVLVFRRGSDVVRVNYLGPLSGGSAAFVQLGTAINSRL